MGKFKEQIWDNKKRRAVFITLTSIFLALVLLFTASAIYLGTYYHADDEAIAEFTVEEEITETKTKSGNWIFAPAKTQATTGFIFYPGGKVEHEAYKPLMRALSATGVLCVLIEMPFRLAIFDINAADGIQESFPEIESWYIGGHSLGGSMAAAYLENNHESFKGLLLLGSYSTTDLSKTNLSVLSIYGSFDKVMNKEKYSSSLVNMPKSFTEIVIEGGCHAYFGAYGHQKGDGTPTISNEEQIKITVNSFIKELLK